jgi:DNA-binding helix-hairpin-helix protein with protein kinase domain
MSQILKKDQLIKAGGLKKELKVKDFLGGGGQGEVHRAELDGQSVAIKWYYSQSATDKQRKALELLIEKGSPGERFLWPQDLVEAAGVKGFGYVMPLRPPEYKSINDLMKRKIEPDFRAIVTACYELAHSFLQLHAEGLCYRDISFGNVFFHPGSGEVLICDNDNVTIDKDVNATNQILGTPRFMAPEIVRGAEKPSTSSDLFSLAVLMFYMLMMHHPLEGKKELSIKCLDSPAMEKIYGKEPVFIFDPNDDSNRPVRGYHDNALVFWPIFPKFIRDLFTRSFTEGIKDPVNGRVRESEWRNAMVSLRDSIIFCNHCGVENFYDAEELKVHKKLKPCWSCQKEVALTYRIRIEKQVIILNPGIKLYPHHIDNASTFDFKEHTAEVIQHPKDPKIWGLKNLSKFKWAATTKKGVTNEVEPGKSVTLASGTKINFGKSEGEIRK